MSEPGFELLGIDHVVIRTPDLDRALAFYCGVLGCHEERRVESLGLVQLRAGTSLVDLVDVSAPLGQAGGAPPGSDGRNMDHLALRIAPFDEAALRSHLDRHQIEAPETAQRYGADGMGPSIYIRDPDGNTIELKGPAAEPS